MVESTEPGKQFFTEDELEAMDDDEFEAYVAAHRSERTQAEIDEDLESFLKHPMNCKELTPEMLNMPEFQALQDLAHEGEPDEVAQNFLDHAVESLGRLLLKDSKHEEKDFQESLHCFDSAFEAKPTSKDIIFQLYQGRAKLNLLRAQFGKCRDDCLNAIKIQPDETMYYVLVRALLFIEKFSDGLKYAKEALQLFPDSQKLKKLKSELEAKNQIELERMKQLTTIQQGKDDEKMKVYRNLIGKGIRLGKAMHSLPASVDGNIFVDKHGKLHFPVLILYEEFMVTDFIQDWQEDTTLRDELRPLYKEKAPWDDEGNYRLDCIEVYFEADMTKPLNKNDKPKEMSKKKHIKVELKQTLLSVLQHANYMVPQYPVLKVISRENDDFKDAFLAQI